MAANVKTKFSRNELLIHQTDPEYILDDASEYVECSLCRARGWRDELVHERECLLADDTIGSVQLIGIRAIPDVLEWCKGSGRAT